jgi:hypothetical protein
VIALETARNVNSQFEQLLRWRWTWLLVNCRHFFFYSFVDVPRSLIKPS